MLLLRNIIDDTHITAPADTSRQRGKNAMKLSMRRSLNATAKLVLAILVGIGLPLSVQAQGKDHPLTIGTWQFSNYPTQYGTVYETDMNPVVEKAGCFLSFGDVKLARSGPRAPSAVA
jgi:hypothetical protein